MRLFTHFTTRKLGTKKAGLDLRISRSFYHSHFTTIQPHSTTYSIKFEHYLFQSWWFMAVMIKFWRSPFVRRLWHSCAISVKILRKRLEIMKRWSWDLTSFIQIQRQIRRKYNLTCKKSLFISFREVILFTLA